jgi:hypothetical protein
VLGLDSPQVGTLSVPTMTSSLHPLFQAIATAPSEQALRLRFMDGVSQYFGVQRWGIYLMDDENRTLGYLQQNCVSTVGK